MSDVSTSNAPIKPDFSQIVSAFAMQALMASGKMMNPVEKKYEVDLTMAQYHIGVLEVLKEKTQGNLSDGESKSLDEMLYQVRMAFVDAQRNPGATPQVVDVNAK